MPERSISITVNGTRRESSVPVRQLLVHYIRDTLGLTGTHIACDTSQCGACSIHVDGAAIKSCTMLTVQADAWGLNHYRQPKNRPANKAVPYAHDRDRTLEISKWESRHEGNVPVPGREGHHLEKERGGRRRYGRCLATVQIR